MSERNANPAPPAWLESIVRGLLPPQAREAMLGDMHERYRSPGRYLREALTILPAMFSSQARRGIDPALFGLQALLLFGLSGGFVPELRFVPLWLVALPPTIAGLATLALRDIYRASDVRSGRRAVGDAFAVLAALIGTQLAALALTNLGALPQGWVFSPEIMTMAAMAPVVLCVLRTGQGVERREERAGVAAQYAQFVRRVAVRNSLELLALGAIVGGSVWFLLHFRPPTPMAVAAWITQSVFALLIVWLARRGFVQRPASGSPADALVAHYCRELARQHRLRRLMLWVWFAPMFMGFIANLIMPGVKRGEPLRGVIGVAVCALLVICIRGLISQRQRIVADKIRAYGARIPGTQAKPI